VSRVHPAASKSLAVPVGLSALVHTGVVATVLIFRAAPPPPMPPMYKVELIAAPAGERAAGVVSNAPAPAVATAAPSPAKAAAKSVTTAVTKVSAKAPAKPVKPAVTPSVAPATKAAVQAPVPAAATAPPPKAGGGATGGAGADVASIRLEGISFPFPGYLNNIERQIALNFSPRGNVGALRAEVFFMIRRDGSVAGFRFLTRSGNGAFDLECQGAI